MFSAALIVTGAEVLQAQNTNAINAGIQFDSAGARTLGMGGAFVAVADDATTVFGNPAGLRTFAGIEVSGELRRWNFDADAVNRGHAFGPPSRRGVDTVSDLERRTFGTHVTGLAFASLVVPRGNWGFGAFHRTHTRYRMNRQLEGPFFQCSGGYRGGADPTPPPYCEPDAKADGIDRLFPAKDNIAVDITSIGIAASYAPPWARVSIGVGLQRMSFKMKADQTIFAARDSQKFAPPNYSDPANVELISHQSGDDSGWTFTTGLLWGLSDHLSVGASYQWQPAFIFCTVTTTGEANAGGKGILITSGDTNGPCAHEMGAKASSFAMPSHFAAGASFRPNPNATNFYWLVSAQYDRVNYSTLRKGFTDVTLPSDSPEGRDVLNHVRIEDTNGVRGGTELVILMGAIGSAPLALTLRGGVFHDPQHQSYFKPDDAATGFPSPRYALYLPRGRDVWHRSGGLGVTVGRVQLDFAADFAVSGNTVGLSTVARF